MSILACDVQRRRAIHSRLIDVDAIMLQQLLDDLMMTPTACDDERRVAIFVHLVGSVKSLISQQQCNDVRVSIATRKSERRFILIVRAVDVGSRAQQQARNANISIAACGMQRYTALGIRPVHVHARCEPGLDGGYIAAKACVEERGRLTLARV